MVEARALPTPWQVSFRADGNEGVADTRKAGTGGSAGLRPHELLEAALATCMTMTARRALAELGITGDGGDGGDPGVTVRVDLERTEAATGFRYALILAPELEAHRAVLNRRIERSPVRTTLSKPLRFEPA
ncbi:hypothetical protein ADL22_10970 [Streptomyces sp. NRRL F-4489]|uniref:OsmC family protein n=1 Tax=Streptomyces sp. NRRL F-4489 TaxID=1609095 RepID=UPI0007470A3C|nr:OsmC family protein [Streptomyces sp. NRRL F-4489]KUL46032.1 hypothetical protein ADL22_10970 [Streptomyces sp. NRRL F-4489]